MRKLNYIQGAFILTITNLVTGTLAFIYRIFLSRSIGAEGMGVYQLVLPLYFLFITLVSGGITTAVSKLVAEQNALHNTRNITKTIRLCSLIIGTWSLLICAVIVLNADYLSKYILKDARTYFSIIVFTPAIFFISLAAIIKGYFYGLQDVNPPALIDVMEKVIRLIGLTIATILLLPYGIELVCAGAMAAMAAGELISLLLLFIAYKFKKIRVHGSSKTDRSFTIIGKILTIAIPLSISGALSTIMDMVNAVLIPSQLGVAGFDYKTALSLYGELTGMVLPLLFYPFIIVSSLTVTLVPAITASYTAYNWIAVNKKCNDSLKITSVVSLAATVLFLIFPAELCRIFFNCPEAGVLLYWLSFSCFCTYWESALFAILNSVGFQNKVLEYSIVNIIITVACSVIFIPIPAVGIYGFIIGSMISNSVVMVMNLKALKKIPQIHIKYPDTIVKPLICFIGMYMATRACNTFISTNELSKYNFIISTAFGLIVYTIMLILTGTITMKQFKNTILIRRNQPC